MHISPRTRHVVTVPPLPHRWPRCSVRSLPRRPSRAARSGTAGTATCYALGFSHTATGTTVVTGTTKALCSRGGIVGSSARLQYKVGGTRYSAGIP